MAKGKYQRWLTPDGLMLLMAWARDGLSDEQLARKIGISTSTLYEWKNKHTDFADSIKKSKEVADFEVESALYKKACSGDVTAQIFWLKNRKPDKWRDKTDMTVAPSNGVLESLLELKRGN